MNINELASVACIYIYIYICICVEDATLLEILLNNLKVSQSKLLQGNKIIAGSAGMNSFQHESSIPGSFFFWRIQGIGTLRSFLRGWPRFKILPFVFVFPLSVCDVCFRL